MATIIFVMPNFTDQTGKTIELTGTPERIVSIVPSQTELLYHLGLTEEVVGITKFCIHPQQWFKTKKRVGGTKNLHINTIKNLQPQLIIANKEENVKEQVEELSRHFPVWTSDISTLADVIKMISSVGEMINKAAAAREIVTSILNGFNSIKPSKTYSVLYLIWKDPYMSVGGDTFIHDMMKYCGFQNVFQEQKRYPTVNLEELVKQPPEIILLSSEPYPFKEKHKTEIKAILPNSKIMLADGEMFSWYGSRLQYAPAYFNKLLHQVNSL